MAAQEKKATYTYHDYLQLEAETDQRWEFFYGEVFAMAGGTKRHNTLVLNLALLLRQAMAGKPCQVFSENVRLELVKDGRYVYPDLMLTCHPDDLADDSETEVRHPSLVIEVLSEGTGQQDQGPKRLEYFQLSSLQYYVLVWQTTRLVEVYERREQGWHYQAYTEAEAHLPLLACSLPLAEVYRQVAVGEGNNVIR